MSSGSHSPTIVNRRARHDYHVLDSVEAGIALSGCEVKSIRQGNVSLGESYATIDHRGEVWLVGMHITPYTQGGMHNPEPRRSRKLLLKKGEIRRLRRSVDQRGYTLVPLRLYFRRGLAKIELGLCRGKQLYDKRAALMERDLERQVQRDLAGRDRGER